MSADGKRSSLGRCNGSIPATDASAIKVVTQLSCDTSPEVGRFKRQVSI